MTLPSELPNKDELVEKAQVDLSNLNLTTNQMEKHIERSKGFLLSQYKDITTFLDEATDEFEIGQLVHLESFGLYDAMSSIEIMDPKMDSGMILESDLNKPQFKLHARLRPEEVLGIIDLLKACVLGTVKCCHLVLDEMTKGNVYEEEDFSANKY
ncbi:5394_t:CDS:2, partial [Funneliformis caledonium]